MKIKSLTLHGFKSFADRTEIEFHDGITAIVGPNGCGKSNISDAFRWVLGEQRPTAIRGARMEEAIFHGTTERKPIHRAEVELRIANQDGILPVPQAEVAIGRTVLRGGDSEYTLNDDSCRMRDVHDLCRDTGLGANAYSIIEGAMVDKILSDKAEERRSLFEEAAEVGRYKDRRRTALRRLGQAEQDLDRLEDVLGEVRSKVRSLARQRGRAQRFRDLKDRRLVLEVAVAESLLERIEERLGSAEKELASVLEQKPGQEFDVERRETELETLRLETARLEQQRLTLAQRAELARTRIEEIERERLLTGERISVAKARIEAIHSERQGIDKHQSAIEMEFQDLTELLAEREARLAELRETRDGCLSAVSGLREERIERKRAEEASVSRLATVLRDLGAIEAEEEVARQRSEERAEQLATLQARLEAASLQATEVGEAIDIAGSDCERLAQSETDTRNQFESATRAAVEQRSNVRGVRDSLGEIEGRLSADRAKLAGLQSMLSSGSDMSPTVGELLAELGEEDGVLGSLADFVQVPGEYSAALEAHLSQFLHGVLVRDWKAVERVRTWLSGRGEGDGLLLLPCSPGPRPRSEASSGSEDQLLDHIKVRFPAGPWVSALLDGVANRSGDDLRLGSTPWAGDDGSGQDAYGAVRLGQPRTGRGVLSRRADVKQLEERLQVDEQELTGLEARLVESVARLETMTGAADALEAQLRGVVDKRHEALGQRDAARARLTGVEESRAEMVRRIASLEEALREGTGAVEAEDGRIENLRSRREGAESTLATERASAAAATAQWEAANSELHERQLELARAEAELTSIREKNERVGALRDDLSDRSLRLAAELKDRTEAIERGGERVAATEGELAELLEQRGDVRGKLSAAEAELGRRKSTEQELESAVRAARGAEREHAERRHGLELELAELRGDRRTLHERLEIEWEASFSELKQRVDLPEDGGPAEWSAELDAIRQKLASLGPVNVLAAQEYDEEKERLDFLEGQKGDLSQARDDLHRTIRQINQQASAAFMEVFEEVRGNFSRIYATLFDGGSADVWLEDPDDPLDSAIEIAASPGGKRTQRIHLLSGGEKALTALALVFAIYLAKPSPFCIMDEVDAPLDEANIGRFTAMLDEFKQDTQFIVITHNARTVEAADWIYGVTMQEPGVTTVVSLQLQDLPSGQVA
ncbi:MAG: chromosome segregation protein SMC [Gemmatimonadota bacterium]